MILDYFRIALKNLTRRKLRSYLTMLGIIIGIASVIALMGLGNGLQEAITGQFGAVSADILTVQASGIAFSGPPGTGVVTPLTDSITRKIEGVSGVDFAASRILAGARIEYANVQEIGVVVSLPEGRKGPELVKTLGVKLQDGRMVQDGDRNRVTLGNNFNKPDNAFGRPINVGDKIKIDGVTVEVVGIMRSMGSFFIDGSILMMEEPMRDILSIPDRVDIIAVKVKDINDVDGTKERIERLMRKERGVKEGEEDFTVQSAQAVIDSVNDILNGVKAFVVIIASISMVVGAIGIINTMFTAVLERRKEIGIMKSIGGRRKDIFALFFIESGLLGAVGGALGIALGEIVAFLGTKGINQFLGTQVAPVISITIIIGALVGSFLLGALSGILPAMQAMKLNPVDALRN